MLILWSLCMLWVVFTRGLSGLTGYVYPFCLVLVSPINQPLFVLEWGVTQTAPMPRRYWTSARRRRLWCQWHHYTMIWIRSFYRAILLPVTTQCDIDRPRRSRCHTKSVSPDCNVRVKTRSVRSSPGCFDWTNSEWWTTVVTPGRVGRSCLAQLFVPMIATPLWSESRVPIWWRIRWGIQWLVNDIRCSNTTIHKSLMRFFKINGTKKWSVAYWCPCLWFRWIFLLTL